MTQSQAFRYEGSGPGARTRDGCSVDFYLLLAARDELEVLKRVLPGSRRILELGCGVGRITHGLLDEGHEVVGVDNSPEMLNHVRGKTVCANIEDLRLDERFDVVLMMSCLINVDVDSARKAILETARVHLDSDGVLICQCHNSDALRKLKIGFLGKHEGIETYVDRVDHHGTRLDMTYRWRIDGREWTQSFSTEALDETMICKSLEDSGLRFDRWLDDRRTWFTARCLTNSRSG
jgi:SAM-dependent methyltransferase